MKNKYRIFLQEWLFLVVSWIIYMAIGLVVIFAIDDFIDYKELEHYGHSWYAYLENIIFGLLFGTLFALINWFTESKKIRQMSFGKIILLKSSLYILSAILISVFITFLWIFIGVFDYYFVKTFILKYMSLQLIVAIFFYVAFFIILTNFLLQVNKKLGPGVIWKLMTGRYHRPKSEHRIFMFLDLKSSTTLAERLGHHQYSLMLRKCFYELTDILIDCKAEVYQYVGDEVVLTWKVETGLKKLNCIRLFFAFQEKLEARKAKYSEQFGVIPTFKAGIEIGEVTVAEIGELKQEIAYHGDVLNTAARIQGQCNTFGQPLLVSEKLIEKLYLYQLEEKFTATFVGNITLRGRQTDINIYSVQKTESVQQLHKEASPSTSEAY